MQANSEGEWVSTSYDPHERKPKVDTELQGFNMQANGNGENDQKGLSLN